MKKVTIKEGINGSGKALYIVETERDNMVWQETFTTMAEAENWIMWAV